MAIATIKCILYKVYISIFMLEATNE